MQAVVLADLAVETASKAVSEALGRPVSRNANLKEVLARFEPPLASAPTAGQVRSQRNAVVHEGIQPDRATAEETVAAAREVLAEVFARVEHDFATFSAVGLVKNPLIREPLDRAVADTDAREAITFVAIAYRRLDGLIQEVLGAASGTDLWPFWQPLWSDTVTTSDLADGRHKEIRRTLRVGAAAVMGPDLLGLARLREMLGSLLTPPEKWSDTKPEAPELPPDEIAWAADFVALVAYSFERRNPGFRKPLVATRREHRMKRLVSAHFVKQYPEWPADEQPGADAEAPNGDVDG